MMLWKCCTQYASISGKLSSGHRTWKGKFSFPFQRKAMLKNTQARLLCLWDSPGKNTDSAFFHFPNDSWHWASIYSCLTSHLYTFFGENSFQVLWPFLNRVAFLLLSCKYSLIYSGYWTFIRFMIYKYFLPFYRLFFLSL